MTLALFWIAALSLIYSLVGYPAILLALSRLFPSWQPRQDMEAPSKVSFLIAGYNEAPVIADKLRNTLALETGGSDVQIIMVCDGSSDGTADAARTVDHPAITVLEPGRQGKAGALHTGLEHCTGDIVVFSDANAMLTKSSLLAMKRHYTDSRVGGVCGQITIDTEEASGIGKSEGLFWRYDQAMKFAESRIGGAVSAQGSVYSLRRALARGPRDGCTDDFDISVAAMHAGKRLVFEPNACTTEETTEEVASEMRRRIRSSERGWRSLMYNASLMNPFRHGWYAWQLFSHKFVRRMNPFLLAILFVSNLFLMNDGLLYLCAGLVQIAFYGAAVAGLMIPKLRQNKIIGLASFFTLAHVALAIGILRCFSGQKSTLWTPARKET